MLYFDYLLPLNGSLFLLLAAVMETSILNGRRLADEENDEETSIKDKRIVEKLKNELESLNVDFMRVSILPFAPSSLSSLIG